jgi:fumarylacetoacetate (FAA) hydrolase family protein
LFAPTQDRDQAGSGFTHHLGDTVRIQSPHLGVLCNRVHHCGDVPPWQFGLRAFFNNLAARGLLSGGGL